MSVADPWTLEAKKGGGGEGGDFETCPAGNYPGTVVGLFDVGSQPAQKKDGTPFQRHDVVIVFELAKKDSAGRPFVMANRYTFSLHEKATFYVVACNLAGKKFGDGERFSVLSILGRPCMVQVTNTTAEKNGKPRTYANVGTVTSYPDEFPPIKPTREPVAWTVAAGRPLPDTSWIPYVYGKSIRDLVQMSDEYKAGQVPTIGGGTAVNASASAEGDGDDQVPW